jgi:hypothetical protein
MSALRVGISHRQSRSIVLSWTPAVCFPSFPSDRRIHPHAEIAAESAEFAGAAGLFWEMQDALFENQSRLSITAIFLIGA